MNDTLVLTFALCVASGWFTLLGVFVLSVWTRVQERRSRSIAGLIDSFMRSNKGSGGGFPLSLPKWSGPEVPDPAAPKEGGDA